MVVAFHLAVNISPHAPNDGQAVLSKLSSCRARPPLQSLHPPPVVLVLFRLVPVGGFRQAQLLIFLHHLQPELHDFQGDEAFHTNKVVDRGGIEPPTLEPFWGSSACEADVRTAELPAHPISP